MRKMSLTLILLCLSLLQMSCFKFDVDQSLTREEIREKKGLNVAANIHIVDGSLIAADKGFMLIGDTLLTEGPRISASAVPGVSKQWLIPLDSVVGVEYVEEKITAGSVLITTGIIAAPFLIKAIFGSCPTVYSLTNGSEVLQTECFSFSIGRQFERADLDKLTISSPEQGPLVLRIKNEALETHYINTLALGIVEHPAGTEAFPTSAGEIVIVKNIVEPVAAHDARGNSVLALINSRDGVGYQPDSGSASRMLLAGEFDKIDLLVPKPAAVKKCALLFRVRNTLEGTVLFYDVMLRDQGSGALELIKALNTDPAYSWRVGKWYKEFSGLRVAVKEDDGRVSNSKVFDTGPITWKDVASSFDLSSEGDSLRVEISMLPDYWSIDWIGFSYDITEQSPVARIEPSTITSGTARLRTDTKRLLGENDKEYVITYPGDWFDAEFKVEYHKDMTQTYFLYSQGYYVEWFRGNWLKEQGPKYAFNPSQGDEIRERMTMVWLAKKKDFEKDFFSHRVLSN